MKGEHIIKHINADVTDTKLQVQVFHSSVPQKTVKKKKFSLMAFSIYLFS